jgi:phosphoenolpyruvate-protein kinase (PTS system EI component)
VGLEEDLAAAKTEDATKELRALLTKTLRQLKEAKAKSEDLVDAVYRATHDALIADPIRPIPAPPKVRQTGKPEVALWHLSDWQGAKVTATYNSEVMRERVHRFVDKAERITAIVPVPDAALRGRRDPV